jgi:hypothetical protein
MKPPPHALPKFSYELQNYHSNQLINAVYDDRFGAELALHL